MAFQIDITLRHDPETRVTLGYVPLEGDDFGFKVVNLSPGALLREYHGMAQRPEGEEPQRAIEAHSYEKIAMLLELMNQKHVQLPPLGSGEQNILSIPEGLSVDVDIESIQGWRTLVGSNICFRDDLITRDPLIWTDTIESAVAIIRL